MTFAELDSVVAFRLTVEVIGAHPHGRTGPRAGHNASRKFPYCRMGYRMVEARFQIAEGLFETEHLDQVSPVLDQCLHQCLPVILVLNPEEALIAAARPRFCRSLQDLAEQVIGCIAAHEESRNADGSAEEDLPPLAFDERAVGNVFMCQYGLRLIFERERCHERL